MKIPFIILFTFVLAMLTSLLLSWSFIAFNPVRYALVVILIIVELLSGFFWVKFEVKNLKENE
jgi:hypothetical protein